MARIAYVDHSYHRTTRSTHFLRDILRRHGHEVQDFWDEAWQGGPPVEWASVRHHDVVIMFQSYCPLPGGEAFRLLHPNVVFIPMLDSFAISRGPVFNLTSFWAPFQGSKVLNFSSTLHGLTTSYGVASHWARFYQPAEPVAPSPPADGLHGFFWLRCEDQINWALLRQLIGDSRFDSFHLHLAGDPGAPEPRLPPEADMVRHRITTSTWFEDRRELTALVERANVYFAPRLEEGIGQSFLEAMARGKCVVAPNQGSMNEYILHGVNGLLYEHNNPRPLDFSGVKQLGQCARDSVVAGHAKWLAAEDGIVDFILTPSERFYVGKYQHVFAAPVAADASAPAVENESAPAATNASAPAAENESAPVAANVPAPTTPNASSPVLAAETLGSSLRALAGRHALFRATRPVWHPLLRLTRRVRRMIQGA